MPAVALLATLMPTPSTLALRYLSLVEEPLFKFTCYFGCCVMWGGGKVRGASLRSGKMQGTMRGINARHWVICEAGMCEAQRTTNNWRSRRRCRM